MIESDNLNFYQDSLDYILKVQMDDGSISWEKDKKLDPWDHIEAAMGLAIGGKEAEARSAFIWLKENQEKAIELVKQNTGSLQARCQAYVSTRLSHLTELKESGRRGQAHWPLSSSCPRSAGPHAS